MGTDPRRAFFEAATRLFSGWYWSRSNALSKQAGYDELYFSLSFDCDNDEDADSVLDVHRKLTEMGVSPAYAVPGEILLARKEVYKKLKDCGGQFLNHGFVKHTYRDVIRNEYRSCFFYDQVSRSEATQDIERGHECLSKLFGEEPKGFRTPHFGTFQHKKELSFLYGVLRGLGYRYSSSTTPVYSAMRGPSFVMDGILEIPVTAVFSKPWRVFDSWGFFMAPGRQWKPTDFENETRNLLNWQKQNGSKGIINLYADPSHISNKPEFWNAISCIKDCSRSITFNQIWSFTQNKHEMRSSSGA